MDDEENESTLFDVLRAGVAAYEAMAGAAMLHQFEVENHNGTLDEFVERDGDPVTAACDSATQALIDELSAVINRLLAVCVERHGKLQELGVDTIKSTTIEALRDATRKMRAYKKLLDEHTTPEE